MASYFCSDWWHLLRMTYLEEWSMLGWLTCQIGVNDWHFLRGAWKRVWVVSREFNKSAFHKAIEINLNFNTTWWVLSSWIYMKSPFEIDLYILILVSTGWCLSRLCSSQDTNSFRRVLKLMMLTNKRWCLGEFGSFTILLLEQWLLSGFFAGQTFFKSTHVVKNFVFSVVVLHGH